MALADTLDARKSSRLIVNLRELRTRFDRSTAETILRAANRFAPGGDLEPYIEAGTLDLALVLEQRSGQVLLDELAIMLATSPQDFGSYLGSSDVEKPDNFVKKRVEEGEKLIEQIVSPPLLTPAGGSFRALQEVTLSTELDGAKIHFTIDNSEPTSSSPVYSEPFLVGEDQVFTVVRVLVIYPERGQSEIVFGAFSVNLDTASAPRASHESDT